MKEYSIRIKNFRLGRLGLPVKKEGANVTSVHCIRGRAGRASTRLLAGLATALVIGLAGCSTAVGTDMPQRESVLKTMRDQGWLFNKHVIDTAVGADQNQVIVSGPLAERTPDNRHVPDGWKVMQYSSVTLQNNNGTWQVASKTPVIREPLSTRERWLR